MKKVISILFICVPLCWGAEGISTSFVDVVADHVPLGKTTPIKTRLGEGIVVTNRGESPVLVTVQARVPRLRQLRNGAKAIPDAGWLAITPREVHLEPHASTTFDVSVTVPDSPENRAQTFQAMILCRGQAEHAEGIVLRAGLLSRLRIITAAQ